MAKGDPITTPWIWSAGDYVGNVIRITVTFDNVTRALSGATVFRDAACMYHNIYIGLGADGSPNSTPHQFAVPSGTTPITAGQLSANGLNTIENILALQVTAGP